MAIINGTTANDDLSGTETADQIFGLAGDDTLNGLGGDDVLDGSSGFDTMRGGAGNDTYVVDQRRAGDAATVLALNGAPGTFVVATSYVFTPADGSFHVGLGDRTNDGVVDTISLFYNDEPGGAGHNFSVDMSTAAMGQNLAPGVYLNALRYPFEDPGHPGLDVSGDGMGPNQLYGSFTIHDIVIDYSGGTPTLVSFSADFEQHSESPSALPLTGTFNYQHGSGSVVPEPVIESPNDGIDTVRTSIDYALPDNVENLVLLGGRPIDGTGNALSNTITGNSGANRLDGGAGADTLIGGAGDDTYIVDVSADVVVENVGGGVDVVLSSASYTLSGGVESLTLTGSASINGTGNDLANTLVGNAGNNVLDGCGGIDVMKGGAGNDTYIVDQGTPFSAGTILDMHGNSYILAGSLTFTPATGNFSYTANDFTGDGLVDTLHFSYTDSVGVSGHWWFVDVSTRGLGLNLQPGYYDNAQREAFAQPGHPGLDVSGDGRGSNMSFGNFTINEAVFDYSGGSPVLQHFSMTFAHYSESPNAIPTVGTLNYNSSGGFAPEHVVELANEGTDTVRSSIDYTLPLNVENLVLMGGDALHGTGNALANLLIGNRAANVLSGDAGTDQLEGAGGADMLDGGAGVDYARYDTAAAAVTASLATPSQNTGDAAGDRYVSIEGFVGSRFNDTLAGDNRANDLAGLDGNDYLQGLGGNDGLQGGNGNDQLEGGAGADGLYGGDGFDYARYYYATAGITADLAGVVPMIGDASGDRYTSIEGLVGSRFNDVLLGDGVGNDLAGLDGNDLLQGRGGNDGLQGGNGNDSLDGGAGADKLTGGAGADTFSFKRGEANGDFIFDFDGAGSVVGDSLVFEGYGTPAQGARLTMIDTTHWRVDSADGLVHETITLANAAPIHPTDYAFM